jgi:competence protein ComEA
MPELVRPEPPPSWRARAGAFAQAHPGALAGAAVAVVAGVCVWFLLQPAVAAREPGRPGGVDPALALPRATTTTTAAPLVVHVAGAVARPGLVRLPPGSRVADAIAAAGGTVAGADLDRLNLAAPLADGSRLYVPFAGRPVPPDETPAGAQGADTPAVIDLNTATAAELESLPGIGPATARAIIEHRQRHGRFRSVDELLAVRGIGPAKLAQIRGRVRV